MDKNSLPSISTEISEIIRKIRKEAKGFPIEIIRPEINDVNEPYNPRVEFTDYSNNDAGLPVALNLKEITSNGLLKIIFN